MLKPVLTFLLTLLLLNIHAQNNDYPYPSLSPKATITQVIGNTMMSLEYERPSVRKRQIFGDLVPWNKVWRTGAGHCTSLGFDKPVVVGGQRLEAGTYSLFTIPQPEKWIIIFNKDNSLYGSYNYDHKKDAARFIAIPRQSSRFYETLTIDIEILPNDARIFISWADVQLSFDVETTTDSEIEELIETQLLTQKSKVSQTYAGAAEYLLYQDRNLSDVVKLADFAIELDNNNGWARSLKIKVYEKMALYEEAISELNQFIEHAESRKYENEIEKKNTLKALRADYERIHSLMK